MDIIITPLLVLLLLIIFVFLIVINLNSQQESKKLLDIEDRIRRNEKEFENFVSQNFEEKEHARIVRTPFTLNTYAEKFIEYVPKKHKK